MDDVEIGSIARAVRRRSGWRQVDVAVRARVSQQTYSTFERGRLDRLTIATARRIAKALAMELPFEPRWNGPNLATLRDAQHARLVEIACAALAAIGWEHRPEYTFSRYGERGSVDIVAWRADLGVVLIIEVKSIVLDLQDLGSTLDRKARIVPPLVASEHRFRLRSTGRVLILPEGPASRSAVARHRATFQAALPDRNRAVTDWLAAPAGPLRGIWFIGDPAPVRR